MSKQLEASLHYMAYKALGRLPLAAEKFDEVHTDNANPEILVHLGELYCRVELPGVIGELCGVRFETRGALVNHIKKYHNHVKVQPAANTGNPSMAKIQVARVFFSALMTKHNEKNTARRSEAVPLPPKTPRKRRASQPTPTRLPMLSERVEPPTYRVNNKKRGQKKGALNYNACAKMVVSKGGVIPCNGCRQDAVDNEKPVPRECDWTSSCQNTRYLFCNDSDKNNDKV